MMMNAPSRMSATVMGWSLRRGTSRAMSAPSGPAKASDRSVVARPFVEDDAVDDVVVPGGGGAPGAAGSRSGSANEPGVTQRSPGVCTAPSSPITRLVSRSPDRHTGTPPTH
jgi:hypothetical protein